MAPFCQIGLIVDMNLNPSWTCLFFLPWGHQRPSGHLRWGWGYKRGCQPSQPQLFRGWPASNISYNTLPSTYPSSSALEKKAQCTFSKHILKACWMYSLLSLSKIQTFVSFTCWGLADRASCYPSKWYFQCSCLWDPHMVERSGPSGQQVAMEAKKSFTRAALLSWGTSPPPQAEIGAEDSCENYSSSDSAVFAWSCFFIMTRANTRWSRESNLQFSFYRNLLLLALSHLPTSLREGLAGYLPPSMKQPQVGLFFGVWFFLVIINICLFCHWMCCPLPPLLGSEQPLT